MFQLKKIKTVQQDEHTVTYFTPLLKTSKTFVQFTYLEHYMRLLVVQ